MKQYIKNELLNFINHLVENNKDSAEKSLSKILKAKGKKLMKEARTTYSSQNVTIPVGINSFVQNGHKVEASFKANVVGAMRYDAGDQTSPSGEDMVGIHNVLYIGPVTLTIDGISATVNVDGLDIDRDYAKNLYRNLQSDLAGEDSTIAHFEEKFYQKFGDIVSSNEFIKRLTIAIATEIKDMEGSDY